MDDRSFHIRVPKRWARVAMIVGVTALVVAPLTAIATQAFNDVPDTHTFHNDIAWLAEADVTRGCNPPDNDRFCPNDLVTRAQMAAFMRRFAQYLKAEDGIPALADHAVTAGNADTLGGAELSEVRTLWMNVHSSFGIQRRSVGLEGAEVRRPPTNPTGVYCVYLPDGIVAFSAVGAPERAGAFDSFSISVTTTVRHIGCEETEGAGERFDIAVETYRDGALANNNFQLMIPTAPLAPPD
jgi:hypothetical protein